MLVLHRKTKRLLDGMACIRCDRRIHTWETLWIQADAPRAARPGDYIVCRNCGDELDIEKHAGKQVKRFLGHQLEVCNLLNELGIGWHEPCAEDSCLLCIA